MTDVSQRVEFGEYRDFPMTLWADTATQKFQATMKQNLSHTIELGSDPVGSIARLNVLRIALNMDGKSIGKRERDKEELDGGKPSIKGLLKRLGVESAATASPPQKGKDMEVAS